MPEGDAVLRTARRLDAALRDTTLVRSDLRFPTVATVNLAGRTTLEVVARGKHLLHRFSGGITLHSHLRMDGSWRTYAATPPTRDHRIRAVLVADGAVAVGTLLGRLDVVRTEHEDRLVGHLGPDLLGPDWDPDRVVTTLSADRRPLGAALLDQTVVAGLGTIWASESLYAAGLAPTGTVRDPEQLTDLVTHAHLLLTAAVDEPRGGRRGSGFAVYGRAGRPCRRCGTPIRSVRVGPPTQTRTLQFCPSCQR